MKQHGHSIVKHFSEIGHGDAESVQKRIDSSINKQVIS